MKSGGVDRIELWHVAHYGEKGKAGKEIILHNVEAIDRKTGEKLLLSSDQGLAPLLEDLRGHLVKKRWFDKTIIHIADEPSFHNLEQWKTAARFVRQHMPGIKTIDAIGATGFGDLLDIMVPLTLNLNILFNEYLRVLCQSILGLSPQQDEDLALDELCNWHSGISPLGLDL